jgi:hypothetical protein
MSSLLLIHRDPMPKSGRRAVADEFAQILAERTGRRWRVSEEELGRDDGSTLAGEP